MTSNSVGNNLIYQRKLKGLTQQELAEKTQVTVRTIQRIEKGDVNPHLQTIKLLAGALDIEVDDLLMLENPKEENIQKKWLLLLHSSPFLGFVIPLANILIPLFLWIHKREDNLIYDSHGRSIINFQITMSILYVLGLLGLVTIEKWGFIFFISVIPFSILVMLINIIKVTNSLTCFYPLAIPFIRKRSKINSTKMIGLLAIAIIGFSSCNEKKIDTIERLDGSFLSKDSLTSKIEELINEAEVHGLGISIFDDKATVYHKMFGYKDYPQNQEFSDTTNIYGASLSKAVFSILVMKLVEEEVIDLDTPLESYLPRKVFEYVPQTRWHDDYTLLKDDSLYHKITARMCLANTTGFANWRWIEPEFKLRVNFEPGSRYGYSGEGFVYLQVVLEKLTGKGLQQLADEIIFKPLGMHHSAYEWKTSYDKDFAFGHNQKGEKYKKDKDNEPRGGSTLETTAMDYTTFLEAVLSKKLISIQSYEELFHPQIRIKSRTQFYTDSSAATDKYDDIKLSYGLGWGYLETPYGKGVFKEGHGDGFQHYSILFPETGKGILIMTNSDNGESIFRDVLDVAIKDIYTPWEWESWVPYKEKEL
ncbi:MAG: serine hydrolase [Bacteroidota bacterium]